MEKKKSWWQQPGLRIAGALILLILLGGAVGGVYYTQTPPEQPIQFPHSLHVGIGAKCQYCHTGAATGPTAGLPSPSKCWGCHQQVQVKSPELDKLAAFVKAGNSIPWVPVAIQPDFVHFNHRPHIAAGVACETCHGDVSKMTVAEPQSGQNMGWCLDCHKRMAPEKWARLSDCATCHY
ncbi:quinol:cytochrome c oxidoreductase pentaheme cytochrome subunit [Longilinea arvoryzae]|uniref:Quinol:cytochrome c oxidoreductase pentaheme cytochrome subunit n=1 Tax=Longilinea arvoryzae TaxID=360412 RepID=A0A0S7BIC6_9CHLR|nr:cytochrome c3 family protein [Longilinea arvoryzae]GAP14056.1 quinol:cytochrome c oxidoreductase pentaheme cytochrome subunit [Longilinea arvoryzae]